MIQKNLYALSIGDGRFAISHATLRPTIAAVTILMNAVAIKKKVKRQTSSSFQWCPV
jgi:hypothetical protein